MSLEAQIDTLDREAERLSDEIDQLMAQLGKIDLPPGTCRWRMVKCGKCDHLHGPYLYVYHRKNGQLEETYMSKDAEAAQKITLAMDLSKRMRAKIRLMELALRKIDKLKIRQAEQRGELPLD